MAFTLVEILVVVAIVAILAALLYPTVLQAGHKGRQKQAMADARGLVLALDAYRYECGRWPAQDQDAADQVYVTNNFVVMRELMGANAQQRAYFSPPTNRLDGWGNYIDPWGDPYVICVDENGDGKLDMNMLIAGLSFSNSWTGVIRTVNVAPTKATVDVGRVTAGVASFGTSNALMDAPALNSWAAVQ